MTNIMLLQKKPLYLSWLAVFCLTAAYTTSAAAQINRTVGTNMAGITLLTCFPLIAGKVIGPMIAIGSMYARTKVILGVSNMMKVHSLRTNMALIPYPGYVPWMNSTASSTTVLITSAPSLFHPTVPPGIFRWNVTTNPQLVSTIGSQLFNDMSCGMNWMLNSIT